MRKRTSALAAYLLAFWLPLVSGAALLGLCLHSDVSIPARMAVGRLFSGPIYTLYLVLTLGLLVFWSRRGAHTTRDARRWWPFDLVVSSFLIVQGLKLITRLPRPSGGPTGFPSGHTAFSFALAWLVFETYPGWAFPWFLLAIAIGWSRIVVHAHFPYQVLAGAALGMALGAWVSHQTGGVLLPRALGWRHAERPGQ